MSFILNKHITIFTDNDMYHANVATLDNRSPILNERIINYIWNLNVFICLSKCQCLLLKYLLYVPNDTSCILCLCIASENSNSRRSDRDKISRSWSISLITSTIEQLTMLRCIANNIIATKQNLSILIIFNAYYINFTLLFPNTKSP